MSEVAPPPPPPSSPLPAQPAQPPTATVASPPPALLELPLGARLEAVIAATTPQGQIEIETAIGRLLLATGFPLPKEGPLTLQLLARGPVTQLLITAIHGLTPQTALRVLGLATAAGRGLGAQGATLPAAPPAAINLTIGATLNATVLRPGAPAAPALPGAAGTTVPGAAAPAAAGAALATPGATIRLGGAPARGVGAPPVSAAGQSATARPGVSVPASGIPSGGPASTATASGPPAGTQFSVRIVSFQPATAGEAPSPLRVGGLPLAPGNTLAGVVTGKVQPSGHPVVQTAAAALIVATRTPLPVGSTVSFEVLSQAAAPSLPREHASAHFTLPPLTDGGWPALEETLAALEEANPAVAQQLAQAVLPRPGAALGANMLFYLVALAGGDLRAWIGDGPMRILQRLRPDLLARLGDDFGQISRIADDRGPGDWRTFLIPFFNGAEVQPIKLHTRQAGDDEDAEKGRKGTRFIVDIELSRLGRLQLDGLVYQKEKHMDLIVRTENRLPPRIENGIRDVFEDANDVTGIKGGIGFQAAPPNFVEIGRPERPSERVGLIV